MMLYLHFHEFYSTKHTLPLLPDSGGVLADKGGFGNFARALYWYIGYWKRFFLKER